MSVCAVFVLVFGFCLEIVLFYCRVKKENNFIYFILCVPFFVFQRNDVLVFSSSDLSPSSIQKIHQVVYRGQNQCFQTLSSVCILSPSLYCPRKFKSSFSHCFQLLLTVNTESMRAVHGLLSC